MPAFSRAVGFNLFALGSSLSPANTAWRTLDPLLTVDRAGANLSKPAEIAKPAELDEIFMRYMPEHNVVVCGSAKCGTTSLYEYIYKHEFGTNWIDDYGWTEPYIHNVTSDRWKGKFRIVRDEEEQNKLMNSAFSVAIIREPRERLISAWKSKLACSSDEGWNEFKTDVEYRPWMVSQLLAIVGANASELTKPDCMGLEEFLYMLERVHAADKAHLLDRHFLPENLGCFYKFKPDRWTQVVSISSRGAFAELGRHIGSNETEAPQTHISKAKVKLTMEALELLNGITGPEHEIIRPFLVQDESSYLLEGHWSSLKAGSWV